MTNWIIILILIIIILAIVPIRTKIKENKEWELLVKKYAVLQNEYNNYQNEYLRMLQDSAENYRANSSRQKEELDNLTKQYKALSSEVSAAIEYNKKQFDAEHFNNLILSDIDIQEIKKIREIEPYLRDSSPLNKIIWKVYYENPYTDLVGRVLGNEVKCGIYKITNMDTKQCYIGKAVNIANRWKTHIKIGIGAESGGVNKLYTAMLENGAERFSFELLEECAPEELDEHERFWINHFKSMEFGYNMRLG